MTKFKRVYYRKLVRDEIFQKILNKGSKAKYRKLKEIEFREELLKKLLEEAAEVVGAKQRDKLLSELADLLCVIDEIKDVFRISAKEMTEARKRNLLEKGGFKKRLFLEWSSDDGYNANNA